MSRCPKANIPRRCASSWPILRRAITSCGSIGATKWRACGHQPLALSTDWCVSQGQLGGEQQVQHVDKALWKGKTAFKDSVISADRYRNNVDMLKILDNDIRYKADSFVFNVPGAPEEVKSVQRHLPSGELGALVQRAVGQGGDD